MYCSNCGAEMNPEAKFCSSCGHSNRNSASQTPTVKKNEILIESAPTFIGIANLLGILPFALFFGVWSGIFFGGFFIGFFGDKIKAITSIPLFVFPVTLAVIIFFLVFILAYFYQQRTYFNTEYTIYPDRIEYTEGFLGAEAKTVLLKNAVGCNLVRGIIQKQFGLGSIRIDMPGFVTSVNSRGRSGFCLADLENPEETYEILNNLIKQNAK